MGAIVNIMNIKREFMSRILMVFVAACLLAGCGRSVEGVIEYYDRGNLVRPGTADILFVPHSEFEKLIQSSADQVERAINAEISALQNEEKYFEEVKKNRNALVVAMAQAGGITYNVNTLGGQYMLKEAQGNIDKGNQSLQEWNKDISSINEKISEHQSSISSLKSGKNGEVIFPIKQIPGSIAITATDGLFKANLEKDVRYVLVARRPSVGLYWFIPLNPKDKTISLSVVNANGKDCEICVPGTKWPY